MINSPTGLSKHDKTPRSKAKNPLRDSKQENMYSNLAIQDDAKVRQVKFNRVSHIKNKSRHSVHIDIPKVQSKQDMDHFNKR